MYYIILSVFTFLLVGIPFSTLLCFRAGKRKSILEVFILASIIGPLIISYVIFILGYLRLLSRESIFLITSAVILLPFMSKSVRLSMKQFCFLIREKIYRMKVDLGKLTLLEALPLSLTISILVVTSYPAFMLPPVLRDPYAVWLFYGKKIMETGTIPLFYGNAPDISWSGNYPPLIPFLASYYFIALDQVVPEAFTHVSWLYGLLTLLATFMLAKELGLGRYAFMSASLLTTSSLFTLELVNYGYVTVAWSFYIAATCFYFVKLVREKTLYTSLTAGLSLGAALLSTYLSFIFVASLLALSLAKTLIRKTSGRALLLEFKPLITGLIVAFAILLPWLIRNHVLLRNPVYPWLYELFGGKGIDFAMIRMVPRPKYNLHQLLIENTFFAMANEDIGYLLLIFGLIGSLCFIWRREEQLSNVGWLTLTFFTFLLASMSLYYGYERYLLMVAPLLAVSAGYLFSKIFSSNRTILKIIALMPILIFSLPSYACLISLTPSGVPVGETKPLSYIEHYIDDFLPPDAIILTNEIQLFFINRKTINVYNLPEAFQSETTTDLINSLNIYNITHVLINTNMDPEVLQNTPLISALTEYKDVFEILIDIYPYMLYKVNER